MRFIFSAFYTVFNTDVTANNLPALIDSQFVAIATTGNYWRSHTYNTESSGETNLFRCGVKCLYDPNCGYFLVENTWCWHGELDTNVAGPHTDNVAIAYVHNAVATRQTSQVSNYFTSTNDYADDLWVKHLFLQRTVVDAEMCAAFCRLYNQHNGGCHFYFNSGTACYMGNFAYTAGLVAPTPGPYFKMNAYDHDAVLSALGGSGPCSGVGYVTTFPYNFGRAFYGNSEYCRWVFYNSAGIGSFQVDFDAINGFYTEDDYDYVRLFTGVSDSPGILLAELHGNNDGYSSGAITAPSLIIQWTSDDSYDHLDGYYGFSGTVSIV